MSSIGVKSLLQRKEEEAPYEKGVSPAPGGGDIESRVAALFKEERADRGFTLSCEAFVFRRLVEIEGVPREQEEKELFLESDEEIEGEEEIPIADSPIQSPSTTLRLGTNNTPQLTPNKVAWLNLFSCLAAFKPRSHEIVAALELSLNRSVPENAEEARAFILSLEPFFTPKYLLKRRGHSLLSFLKCLKAALEALKAYVLFCETHHVFSFSESPHYFHVQKKELGHLLSLFFSESDYTENAKSLNLARRLIHFFGAAELEQDERAAFCSLLCSALLRRAPLAGQEMGCDQWVVLSGFVSVFEDSCPEQVQPIKDLLPLYKKP